jgi:hypothetical protein
MMILLVTSSPTQVRRRTMTFCKASRLPLLRKPPRRTRRRRRSWFGEATFLIVVKRV